MIFGRTIDMKWFIYAFFGAKNKTLLLPLELSRKIEKRGSIDGLYAKNSALEEVSDSAHFSCNYFQDPKNFSSSHIFAQMIKISIKGVIKPTKIRFWFKIDHGFKTILIFLILV